MPFRALRHSVQHPTRACPPLAAEACLQLMIWPHAHSYICLHTISDMLTLRLYFMGGAVAFRRLKGVHLPVHAKGTAQLGDTSTLSRCVCRLTLRLQFMRWRELCKQRLVPCVPAPLLRCAALWRPGRRQGGGAAASQSPEHLRPGLSADHHQVPGEQGTESAPSDDLLGAAHELQDGSGALLYRGRNVHSLPACIPQHTKYDGEQGISDVSGIADCWADSGDTAAEQARPWNHQKAD